MALGDCVRTGQSLQGQRPASPLAAVLVLQPVPQPGHQIIGRSQLVYVAGMEVVGGKQFVLQPTPVKAVSIVHRRVVEAVPEGEIGVCRAGHFPRRICLGIHVGQPVPINIQLFVAVRFGYLDGSSVENVRGIGTGDFE